MRYFGLGFFFGLALTLTETLVVLDCIFSANLTLQDRVVEDGAGGGHRSL